MGNVFWGKEMSTQLIYYTPQWHSQLLAYMQLVYPHRDINYLNWWLNNIDQCGQNCWDKCLLIIDNDAIIGCTTANQTKIISHNNITELFYFRGNTIISPNQRGKGISKKIYFSVNAYNNWISVGVTDIAWKIQPKYVKDFTPIRAINIYIGINTRVFLQLLRKVFRVSNSSKLDIIFPEKQIINSKDVFLRIDKLSDFFSPANGHWTSDSLEIVRDKEFIKKRFLDIYCAERYGLYQYISGGKCMGYVVIRKTIYKGLEMISLVDYRFCSRKDELKAFKVASMIARINHIGFVISFSSRKYGSRIKPFIIERRKKLNCATGYKEYIDKFNDVLFTSADSDLDFVYYK